MIINQNIVSIKIYNELEKHTKKASKSIEKLSSGLRINSASDDAAGAAISEKMRAQIRGLGQAQRNIQDGLSLLQTTDGALGNIDEHLQRMRELSVQASNDTLTAEDRSSIQEEIGQIKGSIDSISENTEFNGIKLLQSNEVPNSISPFTLIKRSSASTQQLNCVGYNGTTYVAMGEAGKILTSSDAVNWTDTGSNDTISYQGITTNGNLFVAVGSDYITGKGIIKTSTDGINWTTQATSTLGSSANKLLLRNVINDGTKFIAFGSGGGFTGTLLSSSDGINWTESTTGSFNDFFDVARNGNTYVGVGSAGDIYTSSNGLNWSNTGSWSTEFYTGVASNGNTFVLVGSNGTIKTSINGENWTDRDSGTTDGLSDIVWNGTNFIATGGTEDHATVLTSQDGITWTNTTYQDGHYLYDVIANGNGIVTVGKSGSIFSSPLPESVKGKQLNIQIGANSDENLQIQLKEISLDSLDIKNVDVSSNSDAENAIDKIDLAIEKVSIERSRYGALQNGLEHSMNNAYNYEMNITSSESRITDVDMAKEMMNQSKSSVLAQAAQAMLAQANQQPQQVLQLLRG